MCTGVPAVATGPRHVLASTDVAPRMQRVSSAAALQVAVMTTLMGSASGLGAVPFFFVGSLSAEWAALANALACGVMLAASFDLVHEGQPYGAGLTILGVILGGPSNLKTLASLLWPCLARAGYVTGTRCWTEDGPVLPHIEKGRMEIFPNCADANVPWTRQARCSSRPARSGWRSGRTSGSRACRASAPRRRCCW